MDEWANSAILC